MSPAIQPIPQPGQIQEIDRLQLAGILAGGIAHDLNNELTVILGYLDLALDQLPSNSDAIELMESAQCAAIRSAGMSRQLVSLSRDRRITTAKMDVAAAVTEARRLLEYIKPPNTRLNMEAETGLFIQGNAHQIERMLVNLGMNAFEAMSQPQGGELEFRALRDHDGMVNISIRDSGCGMSPALQKRIFEPFFTTHMDRAATGLGLPAVKAILLRHDGLLGVESRVGRGTIILLSFPAWKSPVVV